MCVCACTLKNPASTKKKKLLLLLLLSKTYEARVIAQQRAKDFVNEAGGGQTTTNAGTHAHTQYVCAWLMASVESVEPDGRST